MKKILVFFLVAFTSSTFSDNTIIAIVNNTPITLNSIETNLKKIDSKDEQITIINSYIEKILQLEKANEFVLSPSKDDVDNILLGISQSNNITINDLMALEDFSLIKKDAEEKLSILNLQRFITQDLKLSEKKALKECSNEDSIKDQKQIKVSQIIISEIDDQLKDLDKKNILIKKFLNKLAKHIRKGASFEAFAKLHSQHPSYQNGGITDWLPVNGPILEMIDSLSIKEVSEIYLTDFGLAIATKVDERFISSKLKECKERAIYEHAEMYYSGWLSNLREEANIEIYYEKLL
jgi:peptidyl-prolyl cis-trans isomerase SurA